MKRCGMRLAMLGLVASAACVKQRALTELKAGGLDFKLAYGNAPTDICAYQRVGIDPSRTFILGPHGGQGCTGTDSTRGLAGYPDHLPDLALLTQVK